MPPPQVTVLDRLSRFLDSVHPAVARRLLKDGRATVWSREPFLIKLVGEASTLHYKDNETMINPNFTSFFKEEKDVYVQNVSDSQVSVMFEVAAGHVESYLFPNSKDPVCLTMKIPFNAIKNSMDFRKMITRKPSVLVLLSDEEYNAFFRKKAEGNGWFTKDERGKKIPDVAKAIDDALEDLSSVHERKILDSAPEVEKIRDIKSENDDRDDKPSARNGQLTITEIVNPRVLHLCNQVQAEIPDQSRMPAAELLKELNKFSDRMNVADWEHVSHHGFYKSVKNFARKAITDLSK